jgi:hypothetical protein
MDLGNMRQNGVRALSVDCLACGHRADINVDAYPDLFSVPSFASRMKCSIATAAISAFGPHGVPCRSTFQSLRSTRSAILRHDELGPRRAAKRAATRTFLSRDITLDIAGDIVERTTRSGERLSKQV